MNFTDIDDIMELMPDLPLRARAFYWIAAALAAPGLIFTIIYIFVLTVPILVAATALLAGGLSYLIAGLMVRAWAEDDTDAG